MNQVEPQHMWFNRQTFIYFISVINITLIRYTVCYYTIMYHSENNYELFFKLSLCCLLEDRQHTAVLSEQMLLGQLWLSEEALPAIWQQTSGRKRQEAMVNSLHLKKKKKTFGNVHMSFYLKSSACAQPGSVVDTQSCFLTK